jgi:hypothetical protein
VRDELQRAATDPSQLGRDVFGEEILADAENKGGFADAENKGGWPRCLEPRLGCPRRLA